MKQGFTPPEKNIYWLTQ